MWVSLSSIPIKMVIAQPIIPTGSFQPQVGAGNGWLGDVALNYDLLKTTKVSLTAAQAISPLLTGQMQLSDTVGLTPKS